ncbi:universal stress protein [Nocardioides agariphilus]|jgi:nucleotide-binding universal stress UspA family protein|uniref:Universal stress protein n=1 Tax=Nocardioides agariphilus TaxID=433664 RepID=A0A930YLL8_9ACTN|nr:universal stress protein [Nocardioides agariphilus]MBF4767204.1 universal stress protein [Nocardioides agariphilus]
MSQRDTHVVVAVDGSDRSIALLDWAATYAATVGADLKVVTTWQLPDLPGHRPARAEYDVSTTLERRLADLVGQTCTGVPHEVVLEESDTVSLLLREAEDADLIVMGSVPDSHDKQLSRVTQKVLLQAPCPVVVVPSPR